MIDNFIPQIWSARLLANLNRAQIYTQDGIINRDYEGDIAEAGDTVRINSIGRVTISNYAKNTDINAPETLQDAQTVLTINQGKYYNFQIDDVDKAQQKPKVMDSAMGEAAYGLRDAADSYVAGLYTDIAANNWLGSDASPRTGYTAANVYEWLVDLGTVLDENNTPTDGRWCIIPPFIEGYLQKDDRFVKAGTTATDQVLRTGEIGTAAGFRLLKSNNVPNVSGTKYKVIAGHAVAWSFAEGVVKTEAYRPEKRFADAVKGLYLYGAKVTRPDAMAVMVINRS
jgi:hypothetical protein